VSARWLRQAKVDPNKQCLFRVYLYTHRAPRRGCMAYSSNAQMGCCLACGGPFKPKREVLRKDGIASRSLNYVEQQVSKDSGSWGVVNGVDVKLVSKKQKLHMVHKTNYIPVLKSFVDGGKLADVWLNTDPPGLDDAKNDRIGDGQPIDPGWYCITNPPKTPGGRYRFVTWDRPKKIKNMKNLFRLIEDCVTRAGVKDPGVGRDPRMGGIQPRNLPSFLTGFPGCKECNDIMTQEATFRHLLIRDKISETPVVPKESIYRYNLTGTYEDEHNLPNIRGRCQMDPNEHNVSGIHSSFQAALAYYIHRCLPVQLDVEGRVGPALSQRLRYFYVLFAFCLLEVLCLMYERYYGVQGGKDGNFDKRKKPTYRYKGLAELYVSYMLWILLVNDVAEGEGVRGRSVNIQFVVFHRYYFKEMLSAFAITHNRVAGAVEIMDVIFSDRLFSTGRVPVIPGRHTQIRPPERVIGYMAECIYVFYEHSLKRFFSRHIAGLDPVPLAPGASDVEKQWFGISKVVYDMLISREDLDLLMEICERAAPDDLDSCMNHVGVHAVISMWMDMLATAPDRVNRLIGEWVDAWTLREYVNIQEFLRQNPVQPRLSEAVAESIYLLCNALDMPTEPTNQDELEVLKAAPRCSVYKAALRLEKTGAFRDEE